MFHRASKAVERNFDEALAALIWFWQPAAAHIDLQGGDDQFGSIQCGVARLPQGDKIVFADAVTQVDVVGAFVGDRRLPADGPAVRGVVVTDEQPRLSR